MLAITKKMKYNRIGIRREKSGNKFHSSIRKEVKKEKIWQI